MKKLVNQITWLQWFLIGAFIVITTGMVGLAFGTVSGNRVRQENLAKAITVDIQHQYDLGVKDFEDGNYALARQRFDYVLQQNPKFPGVVDMLAETVIQLSEPTHQPTEVPDATQTPTPTPDTREADDLFVQAEQQFVNQDWKNLVQSILSLRDINPQHRTQEVDRMLYLALYFSGIDKILNDGNLEGGLYDLALVERFTLLDSQARIYQEWARLYQIGVSFWGVLPEKSAYYFSQLASAAPYLRDFSGIYAKDRYRMALVQYGDQLTQAGEWCLAIDQYKLSQTLLDDQTLQPTLTFAEEQCLSGNEGPKLTPGSEVILTATPSNTPILTLTLDTTPMPTVETTPEPSPTEFVPTETPVPTPTSETSP